MKQLVAGVLVLMCVAGGSTISTAQPDDVNTLRQEIKALQKRIQELEARQGQVQQPNTQAPLYAPAPVWDPWAEMDALEKQMQALTARNFGTMAQMRQSAFTPDYDLKETPSSYILTFDMPGMDKSKINVEVKENTLYVSGERSSETTQENNQSNRFYRQERSFGYFSRSIALPQDARAESMKAKYDNGVLTVTIDKRADMQRNDRTQKIEIK